MRREWIFHNNGEDLLQFLLCQRGVKDEAVEDFMSSRPRLTHDPFLLKDMNKSANRILSGIMNGEKICIYGDYDADGVCSITLLLEILGKLGATVSYYIPSRFEEGYGLNKDALRSIRHEGVNLIVTVDCGSNSFPEVEYAKKTGIDIIVTDHHNILGKAADCLLINPKQKGCRYPEKELSGCGVAFKLAQGLMRTADMKYLSLAGILGKSDLNRVLDLVAIATVGDIMPLLGENRTLVKYGLRVINKAPRPGLSLLIKEVGLKEGEIKSDDLAYVIVPHLNAAGRLNTAETGVTLLYSSDITSLRRSAADLLESNRRRRQKQEEAYKKTVAIVEELYRDDLVLIVDAPFAHEGIAGIVAGKLKEAFHRPAIVVTPSDGGSLKGTGRSVEGINLFDMLSGSRSYFDKFGGHAAACGFQMRAENLPLLRKDQKAIACEIFKDDPSLFSPKVFIDGEVDPLALTPDFIKGLDCFEPFGHGNRRPVLCVRDIKIKELIYMGDDRQHARFSFGDLTFVLFNRADEIRTMIEGGKSLDLVGYAETDRYRGGKIQFVVMDMRCYNK